MAPVEEGRAGCPRCWEPCISLSINTGYRPFAPPQAPCSRAWRPLRRHSQLQTVLRGGKRPRRGHQRKRDKGSN